MIIYASITYVKFVISIKFYINNFHTCTHNKLEYFILILNNYILLIIYII